MRLHLKKLNVCDCEAFVEIFNMWLDKDGDLCNIMLGYGCSSLVSNTCSLSQ